MPFDVTRGVELPETDEPATPRTIEAITLAGLPALQGSEADIALATEIRTARLIEADDLLSALRGNEAITTEHPAAAIPIPPVTHTKVQGLQEALNRLRHQKEARWWIDHQNSVTQDLLDMFVQ